jgi:hypothetical protein
LASASSVVKACICKRSDHDRGNANRDRQAGTEGGAMYLKITMFDIGHAKIRYIADHVRSVQVLPIHNHF